ncbi:DUF58 domain-containing protein [Atopomonas sediminilitoris]|uniref:DUF58 domain-containing protein n=1 Tax=Atopomonas sediminilitoris TaxID=2919919 RepID=UPI001F4D7265|nr:DUF58 domain-containing protein [Atopomonas sediminilitoris]MCJ8168682.1 DUF58 domain-containing protein [Atopomonas sediminilitoris]
MRPTARLIALCAALLALSVLTSSLPLLGIAWPPLLNSLLLALCVAALLVVASDAWLSLRQPNPRISRDLPGQLPLGRASSLQLTIHHDSPRAITVELFDHLPDLLSSDDLPLTVPLEPGRYSQAQYTVTPIRRGACGFSLCELRLPSLLGFWQLKCLLPVPGHSKVYPDFARVFNAELTSQDLWLGQLGVRQRQRRGLGLDFHQLREYRESDTVRQIDWKATARKRSLIAREYQDERDQQIIFLLDCGRRMRSQDGDFSHFDHALNALLLLTHVALRQGDAVGVQTFASDQTTFIPAAKGHPQLMQIMNAVYDLHSSLQPADYIAACEALLKRQKRRALVIVLSNLRDESDDELLPALRRLSRQHRVLVTSLREAALDDSLHSHLETYEASLDYCGAVSYRQSRELLHTRLRHQNINLLDVRPQVLGPQLISEYLAMKRAGAL